MIKKKFEHVFHHFDKSITKEVSIVETAVELIQRCGKVFFGCMMMMLYSFDPVLDVENVPMQVCEITQNRRFEDSKIR